MAVKKTDADLQAYLDALARCGVRTRAARAAGTTYPVIKRYIESDPQFAEAEQVAFEEAADFLESCAWDRATEGYVMEVEHEIEQIDADSGEVSVKILKGRKYLAPSDGLLTTLLKASRPDKFAERTKAEHTGKDGTPLLDDTATGARLASILADAKARRDGSVEDLLS